MVKFTTTGIYAGFSREARRPQYNEYDAIAPGRMADPREGGPYGQSAEPCRDK